MTEESRQPTLAPSSSQKAHRPTPALLDQPPAFGGSADAVPYASQLESAFQQQSDSQIEGSHDPYAGYVPPVDEPMSYSPISSPPRSQSPSAPQAHDHEKRKAKNRDAQRAFRQRQNDRILSYEVVIENLSRRVAHLEQENSELRSMLATREAVDKTMMEMSDELSADVTRLGMQ